LAEFDPPERGTPQTAVVVAVAIVAGRAVLAFEGRRRVGP
jgi:hypothetical protein